MERAPALLFGTIARQASLLRREQLERLLLEQAHTGAPLGEMCLTQGLLTPDQLRSILAAQRADGPSDRIDGRLGSLAVENGWVSESDLTVAMEAQKGGGPKRSKLGEILVQMESLTSQQVRALLAAQARLRKRTGASGSDPGWIARALGGLRGVTGWFKRSGASVERPAGAPTPPPHRIEELLAKIGEAALHASLGGQEAESARSAAGDLEAAELSFRRATETISALKEPAAKAEAGKRLVAAKDGLERAAGALHLAVQRLGRHVVDARVALEGQEPKISEVRAIETGRKSSP